MGTDKALVEFRGQPLIAHALQILRAAGLNASIAGVRPTAQPILATYAPLIPDNESNLGPLGGVCAALASITAPSAVFIPPGAVFIPPWAVFIPVDQPLLPPALIQHLLHRAQATGNPITLASVEGFAQTFPAVVARAALPTLQAELDAGRAGCWAAFNAAAAALGQTVDVVPAEPLAQSGQVSHPEGLLPANWFLNINSAKDLLHAEIEWKNGTRRP